jgi:Cation efflux family
LGRLRAGSSVVRIGVRRRRYAEIAAHPNPGHLALAIAVLYAGREDGQGCEPIQMEKTVAACVDECCAPPALPARQSVDRPGLVREALRLEWLTIAWMSVEAVVAISSGWVAGSLVLTAFGLDSLIELASAGVLMWRLSVELRHDQKFSENAERLASRIGGGLLFALAAYVAVAALWSLWTRNGEAFSWPGFIVALAAIPSMRYLARRKIAVAEKLGSRALRADAVEAVTCGWLSFVVVISLAAQWAFGAWWIDGVGSLAIVWLLVKEGREAWSGKECGCC